MKEVGEVRVRLKEGEERGGNEGRSETEGRNGERESEGGNVIRGMGRRQPRGRAAQGRGGGDARGVQSGAGGNHHGTEMAGMATEESGCRLPFVGGVVVMDTYQVLVSVDGAARLEENKWDRLVSLPANAVMASKSTVLAAGEGGAAGYVKFDRRETNLVTGDGTTEQESVNIITEVEPISYLLSAILRDEEKQVLTESTEILASTILNNTNTEEQEVEEALDYTEKELLYWGGVPGTITGIPVRVIDPLRQGARFDLAHTE
ncbi:hypothetical protein Pcinc_023608 [Petrolisthes cinctipes]|uniref:Uncharacterized protein n=1 Tax=Petrolisthes cinctipes TaxID=88211 RepID=A0AAE1FCM6_PETCI|nr:hypothetical protein Pcinc_023608 [Petrolisthes cinctipes]